MATILGFLLVIAAAAYVALPFIGREEGWDSTEPPVDPEDRLRWERQKVEAYAAIKEAELDKQMGKLSDVDFHLIRNKYAGQAVEAIAALERIDNSIRSHAGRRPARIAFCPGCGHTVPPRARFCGACGGTLGEAVA